MASGECQESARRVSGECQESARRVSGECQESVIRSEAGGDGTRRVSAEVTRG